MLHLQNHLLNHLLKRLMLDLSLQLMGKQQALLLLALEMEGMLLPLLLGL